MKFKLYRSTTQHAAMSRTAELVYASPSGNEQWLGQLRGDLGRPSGRT